MYRLSALFEEDIDMQDALEDINGIVDDSEDMIITSFEDRNDEDDNPHLFDSDQIDTDEDELTPEEELAVNVALLDDDIEDDINDADIEDDTISIAIGNDEIE